MIKKIFQCVLCLITTSCQSFIIGPDQPGYHAIFSYGEEMRNDYGLRIVSFGGGTDKGKKTFNFILMGQQTPTRDEARAIFYNVTQGFLERLNLNEKLLELNEGNYYTMANIEIRIMFARVENSVATIGNSLRAGHGDTQFVLFFTYNAEKGETDITYREPYEELKRIVEQQRCSSQCP